MTEVKSAAVRTAAVQTDPVFGDVTGNVERALEIVPRDCDLAVLPELFSTGYQFRSRDETAGLAEDLRGGVETSPTCAHLADFAREYGVTLVAGLAERAEKALYNSAVLVRPDGSHELYRKVHLFWDEKDIFTPGDLGFPVFEACGTKVGMMVCFDWVFPEAARSLALAGAEILAHPSNLVLPWCPEAMITRCRENRVFAVTSNRTGREERTGTALEFIGMSQIVAPDGALLVQLGGTGEGAACTSCTVKPGDKKITPRNDLFKDRRPDQYRY